MFFNKEEVFNRVHRRWNKLGQVMHDPIGIHHNTRCKLDGFLAVGPLYQGKHGMAWFDIRIKVGTEACTELENILRQVCNELRISYSDVGKTN